MSSRSLADLHPEVRGMAIAALGACAGAGLDVLVTCTARSNLEQADLYAIGRTKPGRIATNARPGQSAHNFRIGVVIASLALDVVPMRNGKPIWGLAGDGIDDNPADDDKDDLELWQKVRAHFEKAGLKSASRWQGKMREWPHFEHPRTREMMGLTGVST